MARSICGFVDDEGWVNRFVGSWCDLADGRGWSISSWVRGTISPSCGGDEDGDLTGAISNSTARPLSLSLRVCESFLSLFLSLRVFGNDLKVKQKLKIFSGSKGLFYGESNDFSENSIFHAQPNTQFHVKGFPEIVFSQNKHSQNHIFFLLPLPVFSLHFFKNL